MRTTIGSWVLGTALVAMLAGCGVGPSTGLAPATTGHVAAASTQGLKEGFDRINQAVFNKLDANHDGYIDEYEAGPTIPLNSFTQIDRNGDGKIPQQQFLAYATAGGFFSGPDNEDKFLGRMRDFLGDVFNRLDANHDGYLSRDEVSDVALAKLGLGFEYPVLNISVAIPSVSDAAFKAADHTGDNQLSQAEWEDCYIDLVVTALSPAPKASRLSARSF